MHLFRCFFWMDSIIGNPWIPSHLRGRSYQGTTMASSKTVGELRFAWLGFVNKLGIDRIDQKISLTFLGLLVNHHCPLAHWMGGCTTLLLEPHVVVDRFRRAHVSSLVGWFLKLLLVCIWYVYMYTYIYIYTWYISVYIYIYMIHICIYIYIYMYVYIYIYMI